MSMHCCDHATSCSLLQRRTAGAGALLRDWIGNACEHEMVEVSDPEADSIVVAAWSDARPRDTVATPAVLTVRPCACRRCCRACSALEGSCEEAWMSG